MNFINYYQEIIEKAIGNHPLISQPSELYEPIDYIIKNGGKRLRPVLLLMATDAFRGNLEKAIKPALAIEFFHNFTLIHDDIMDQAPLRRGKPTIHSLYGINAGILCGDALLMKSYQFFEDLEPNLFKNCIQLFTSMGVTLCEGQQMDVNFETQSHVSYDDYIKMITYKTGVLSALSLKIGTLISGATTEDAEAMYEFGKHLGIAFQIMDDYLDVFGDENEVGKKYAGDIFENKKTILYLMAMANSNAEDKENLQKWYATKTKNKEKLIAVKNIFINSKANELVLDLVEKHNKIGRDFLNKTSLSEDKKKVFIDLAQYLLKRTH